VTINPFSRFEYRWADGVQIKKPIEVSAPKYVEYLMDWIEAQLDDESIFPQKLGTLTTHLNLILSGQEAICQFYYVGLARLFVFPEQFVIFVNLSFSFLINIFNQ
jgi:hypothetical protein